MRTPSLLAVGILSGTVIGAGMFSLPFVFRTIGFGAGLGYLALFTGVYVVVHRMYASLLMTRGDEGEFIRLAEAYLPHRAATVAGGTILCELFLVLVIYLMLAPSFIELILPGMGMVGALLFWAFGSTALFLRTSWLGWGEVFGVLAILGIVGIVAGVGGARILPLPPVAPLTAGAALLPFGPLLFSLAGRPAVGKVVEIARVARTSGQSFRLGSVLTWGTVLPAAVYAVFVIGILRLAPDVHPDAVSSLTGVVPGWLLGTLGILGLLTLSTSYVVIGVNIKEMLERDLRWGKVAAALVAVLAPLCLYAAGVREFLTAISFAGGVFLSLEGALIVAMWRRAFLTHPFRSAALPLYLIFLAAFAYEVAHLAEVV